MFSFYLLTYVRHSLLPTVRYLWSTLKRRLKLNEGIFGAFSFDSKGKQFPLVFLLLLICSISLGGRCCIPLFTVHFYSMNARIERVCRNGTRGGGARVDKWVGRWEVPTLSTPNPSPSIRSLFLVICSTNTPHCVKVA